MTINILTIKVCPALLGDPEALTLMLSQCHIFEAYIVSVLCL